VELDEIILTTYCGFALGYFLALRTNKPREPFADDVVRSALWLVVLVLHITEERK
jgi:hypothetical protein